MSHWQIFIWLGHSKLLTTLINNWHFRMHIIQNTAIPCQHKANALEFMHMWRLKDFLINGIIKPTKFWTTVSWWWGNIIILLLGVKIYCTTLNTCVNTYVLEHRSVSVYYAKPASQFNSELQVRWNFDDKSVMVFNISEQNCMLWPPRKIISVRA